MNQLRPESKMAERQSSKSGKNRERQLISVPFVWEHKPGIPNKDWRPTLAQQNKSVAPPMKLVVSVPFGWEEKPGTPLQSFVQPQKGDTLFVPSSQHSIILSPPPSHLPELEQSYGWSAGSGGNIDHGRNEDGFSESEEVDTCSFETGDSFTSARSNNPFVDVQQTYLVPARSNNPFVDVQQTSLAPIGDSYLPDSETESVDSSYATGAPSLVGQSFLEWLFPLLVPGANGPKLNEAGCQEMDSVQKIDVQMKEVLQENHRSQMRKPLLTLGELIVMSRRRSCQRKITKLHKQASMDFMKGNALGCCLFGSGNGISTLPIKWKRQLQLKLM